MRCTGMKTLRLLLGDQLNKKHSWFKQIDHNVIYLMMEIVPEMTYAKHHIQKMLAFMHAMRNFAKELQQDGHVVRYIKLKDPDNQQSFYKNILKLIEINSDINKFEYQMPDEYRLDEEMKKITNQIGLAHQSYSTEHFLTHRQDVCEFFTNKKIWRMEEFYRYVRKKYSILMVGDKPIGDKWNYDQDNRKKWDPEQTVPNRIKFNHDVEHLKDEIDELEIGYIGSVDVNNFNWPSNEKESLLALNHFIKSSLDKFGDYQDAMANENPFLFHSLISFALNTKMLSPIMVAETVERYLKKDLSNLSAVEGFIRQIIGWREYIRGVYWAKMPEYGQSNFLKFKNKLPEFFWHGKTNMNCLQKSIQQSLQHAYAHHIQRLMILGNFMLLSEVDPQRVHEWFLAIYIDAIEWVEMPNVLGMSQYADGGLLATKPYVSSGSYINKMGNYCKSCQYDVKTKFADNSCPFNSLYWSFFLNNPTLIENNPRMGIVKMQINKMNEEDKGLYIKKSKQILKNIEQL